jgi:hypothetical protein
MTEAQEYDQETPVIQCAKVFEFGATKYADDNWRKGMPLSKVVDSLARHYIAVHCNKEYVDPESNCPHYGHILANLIFMKEYHVMKPEGYVNDWTMENRDD